MNAIQVVAPATIAQVCEAVTAAPRVIPHGSGTKPALSAVRDATALDLRGLSGILEYEPGEFTFTALAGTPLHELSAALAEHGQALPFDPPFAYQGATLGGAIAAGLSGSGRFRYGGLRDFIVGVQIVDGSGKLVRGGGKVVKNAAGFDLPKLMVGSAGRLGVIVSASFKVFPAPLAWRGLAHVYPDLTTALGGLRRLMAGTYDLEALDLLPNDDGSIRLFVVIGGTESALAVRVQRLQSDLGGGDALAQDDVLAYLAGANRFSWAPMAHALVKVPVNPARLAKLDALLAEEKIARRYAVGGNLAWLAPSGPTATLSERLSELDLSAMVIRRAAGDPGVESPWIGRPITSPFLSRIRAALDPAGRFADFA